MGTVIIIVALLCFIVPIILGSIQDFISDCVQAKYKHEEKMLELEVKRLEETNKSINWIMQQEDKDVNI